MVYATCMLRVKGRVDRGRLIVDEPIDLPEGAEVDVIVQDEEWPRELDDVLSERMAEADRGELHTTADVLARLRGR